MGEGQYGTVDKVRTKCCGSLYAMKDFLVSIIISPEKIGYWDEEFFFARFFQLNDTPYVLRSYSGYYNDMHGYVCYDLFDETLEQKNLDIYKDKERIEKIIVDLFSGIANIHKHKIVHCDIKPENIGFTSKMELKIFDFGLAIKKDSGYEMNEECGTPFYMPPENLTLSENMNYSSDWYAFAVICYEILEEQNPYPMLGGRYNLYKNIKKENFKGYKSVGYEDLKDLLNKMLEPDKNVRLGYGENATEEILKHKFFKDRNVQVV